MTQLKTRVSLNSYDVINHPKPNQRTRCFPFSNHHALPAGTGCLRGQRTIAHLWNDKHGKGSSSLKCTVEPWSLAKYERKQGLTPPE